MLRRGIIAITLLLMSTTAFAQESKRTLALEDFEYSSVMTSVQAIFGTAYNVGRGIKAMLVDRLAKTDQFSIVERGAIDKIMAEQDFAAGNRVQKGTGSVIGKIKGADAYVMGDITTFGNDDVEKTAGGIGGVIGVGLGGFGMKRKDSTAVVAITYRLVDATTGEIIHTAEARGESSRKSKSFVVGGAGGGAFGAGGAGMNSSNFRETIIGEATVAAVEDLAAQIETEAGKLPERILEVSALIAQVNGPELIITAGTNQGVSAGLKLKVMKVVSEIKHPVTGEIIGKDTESIGEVQITRVQDSFSYGTYMGSQAIEADKLGSYEVTTGK